MGKLKSGILIELLKGQSSNIKWMETYYQKKKKNGWRLFFSFFPVIGLGEKRKLNDKLHGPAIMVHFVCQLSSLLPRGLLFWCFLSLSLNKEINLWNHRFGWSSPVQYFFLCIFNSKYLVEISGTWTNRWQNISQVFFFFLCA